MKNQNHYLRFSFSVTKRLEISLDSERVFAIIGL